MRPKGFRVSICSASWNAYRNGTSHGPASGSPPRSSARPRPPSRQPRPRRLRTGASSRARAYGIRVVTVDQGECWIVDKHMRAVSRDEALRLLGNGSGQACDVYQPDTALGVLPAGPVQAGGMQHPPIVVHQLSPTGGRRVTVGGRSPGRGAAATGGGRLALAVDLAVAEAGCQHLC
ncbi:DUF6233 domain-containing protein [Streptomyces sp. NPDC058637]|uniref:DUF6233 domain-containing protein n=1 Tax=Streptomyces sp. NPDC058637 TaxID=3346569 RepID=UPI00365FB7F0